MPPKREVPTITPVEIIPPAYVTIAPLPGGRHQATDDRKCYHWDGNGTLVEDEDLAHDEDLESHQ